MTRRSNNNVDSVHDSPQLLFERQAALTPDAPALVSAGTRVSYRELNARANRFAHHLLQLPGRPERVAVCMRRSPDLVAALLGVLKAGAATVPIAHDAPVERKRSILADANPNVVLTDEPGDAPIEWANRTATADAILRDDSHHSTTNPPCVMAPDSVWTIVYTSGVSGVPKGVIVPIGAVMYQMRWMWGAYPFVASDVALLHRSSMLISASWDYFGPLLRGVPSVILNENWNLDPSAAWNTVVRESVSVASGSPSMWQLLIDQAEHQVETWRSLRLATISGEQVTVSLVRRWYQAFANARLLNVYGASECIRPAVYDTSALPPTATRVPIGRALPGLRVEIVDEQRQSVAHGTVGEMSFEGPCVSAGYLNQPELTNKRFARNASSALRVYYTGDLGRFNEDGNLEVVGRADRQLKVRGFRVEPEEVEAAILSHSEIRQVAVVGVDAGETGMQLVAFYVESQPPINEKQLRADLRATLPEYMLPQSFVPMQKWPLTTSGKADVQSLAALAKTNVDASENASDDAAGYVTSNGRDVQRNMTGIWSEVFRTNDVDLHTDFFDAGGHSLIAMQLLSRIRTIFGIELSMTELFASPTVGELSTLIQQRVRSRDQAATGVTPAGAFAANGSEASP